MRTWLDAPNERHHFQQARSWRDDEVQTGRWFIDGHQYQSWKASPCPTWLWLHGKPGCGKTVLNATIVEALLNEHDKDSNRVILYYYFNFNDGKASSEPMIRSLVQQLAHKSGNAPGALTRLFRQQGKNGYIQPTMEELLFTVQEILSDYQEIFLVVDALDECKDLPKLLETFRYISKWKDLPLRVLLTSRLQVDIFNCLSELVPNSIVDIRTGDTNQDIRDHVRHQLNNRDIGKRFKAWNDKTIPERVEEKLLCRADGMFLLVSLQFQELAKCRTVKALNQTLESFPSTLDGMINRILSHIKSHDVEIARRVLCWLAHSCRPLRLSEIEHAVGVEGDEYDPDATLFFNRDSCLEGGKQGILDLLPSVVTIISDPTIATEDDPLVQFVHLSIKEYLVFRVPDQNPATSPTYRLQECDSHQAIARVSLVYLSQFSDELVLQVPGWATKYPLARYAAEFWVEHDRRVGRGALSSALETLVRDLFSNEKAFCNWIRLFDPDTPQEAPDVDRRAGDISSPLYYASLLGITYVLPKLIAEASDLNASIGFVGSALHAAASRGHLDAVRLLLKNGANVREQAVDGGHDSLQAAADGGRLEIVNFLLDSGADVNAQGGHYGTALTAACYRGHTAIVRRFLDASAEINTVGGRWDTALTAASWSGHSEIVTLLLDHGATVNVQSPNFGTPLQAASCDGHAAVVEQLLARGANPNVVAGGREWFGTALAAAASSGWLHIVKRLLDAGADVNLRGGKYGTALQTAAARGDADIVRYLLEQGANPHDGGRPGTAIDDPGSGCISLSVHQLTDSVSAHA
ncbi:hypothetical protein LTS15_006975 [Exophiala xenobiotica]|nr:hypothetical protein LTS15_006975 [Exophiala xenobiotica]